MHCFFNFADTLRPSAALPAGLRDLSPARKAPRSCWRLGGLMISCCLLLFPGNLCLAQEAGSAADKTPLASHSRQDWLRGSITPEREWWDLLHYDLAVQFAPEQRTLTGSNQITFRVLAAPQRMQIDLQQPLELTAAEFGGQAVEFEREGNVYWLSLPGDLQQGKEYQVNLEYAGKPQESRNPPWSGGVSWQTDERGQHFIATSCQGIGASIWWPNKDHGYDEPDRGMDIRLTVPADLVAVANGRLVDKMDHEQDQTRTFHWRVTQPINNYSVNANIGNYVKFGDRFEGEGGSLEMEYWVLAHQKDQAVKQFVEAPRTIEAFEFWFGKYPFYEDSYKLVTVPYLGMEHQSSVTYGNGFRNGYRGTDLSGTGVGLKFDFIIVHESGHEWFGNNISMKDAADMWIHESFTNYSECLFVEYHFDRQQAEDYVIGCRKRVRNDQPIIGTYHVNQSGSGDMYYKGGNMLHTIRHVVDDDKKWRAILRGLNQQFWHQTVETAQIERYMIEQSGCNLQPIFDQYLRTAMIPEFCYERDGSSIRFWFENVVEGFKMPLELKLSDSTTVRVVATARPQHIEYSSLDRVEVDRNFYVVVREITRGADK